MLSIKYKSKRSGIFPEKHGLKELVELFVFEIDRLLSLIVSFEYFYELPADAKDVKDHMKQTQF